MAVTPVLKLIPAVQKYDWGKIGSNSKVAQFAAASKVTGFVLDENTPYAELWMGTHPAAASRLLDTGETLQKHLVAHPELLGEKVIKRFHDAAEGQVPFLFKVLAIRKALSIQTHPDKQTAEELHRLHPEIYKDDNHKPEMALALTPFSALCGFLPLPEIASYLSSTPEFAALVPAGIQARFHARAHSASPNGSEEKMVLKDVFSAVMTADPSVVQEHLIKLVSRYKDGKLNAGEEKLSALVVELDSQFPGDIGVFCVFLLNYTELQPGQAIFLGAGEPHAYITGDIIECMATSDNVIRAGLTPKLRDVPNLIAGLTYNAGDCSHHMVQPSQFNESGSVLYDPPIPEFSVVEIKARAGHDEAHRSVDGPSIAIVVDGQGTVKWGAQSLDISAGEVVFVGADVPVDFSAHESLTVYRAFVEVN